jgi:hypothetical protein
MKKIGFVVLLAGLAGFFVATPRALQSEAPRPSAVASHGDVIGWEEARWLSLGAAVFGFVLVLAPETKRRSIS